MNSLQKKAEERLKESLGEIGYKEVTSALKSDWLLKKLWEASIQSLAGQQKTGGWISVEDDLPQPSKEMKWQVYSPTTLGVSDGFYWGHTNAIDPCKGWSMMGVTHYKILPLPPTGEPGEDQEGLLRKQVERWKDEYGAMEGIIADYQVTDRQQKMTIETARNLIFQYWKKEHPGIPSSRISEEWKLFINENYI